MDEERRQQQLLTALTTEHFALAGARNATISEANGRASIFLGVLSSGLIALGFVGPASERFGAFAGVVFPALLVLGAFTFVRLVQTSTENVAALMRIAEIHAFYATLDEDHTWFDAPAPGSTADDRVRQAWAITGGRPSRLQLLFTVAAMVGAINSLVLGTACCLLLRVGELLPLAAAASAGVVVALASFAAHAWYEQREFRRLG